jgi:hypothetical protein
MISGAEAARRLKSVSGMRDLIIGLKQSALEQYQQGIIPFQPLIDIRSDVEYWKNLAREKRIQVE